MKRKYIRRLVVLVAALILAGGLIYLGMLAPVITGYAAKNLASGVFVAGRTQESMEREDLRYSLIKYNRNRIDYENKEVTSRFLFWESKALYNEGLGSTLVNDFAEEKVDQMEYPPFEAPDVNPDTIPWPAGDLLSDTIPRGIQMSKLKLAVDQAFADTIPFKGTFALLVVYKDQIVLERYRADFSSYCRFLSWSMAKSFTNALTGILVKEGKMDIHKPLMLKEWQNDDRREITMNNLLQMNSGLDWNEDYGNLSDVTVMLHKAGDMGTFAASKKLMAKPGTIWRYSSGTTNIVCDYLRTLFPDDASYHTFPRKALFSKVGMRSALWEPDASGTFVGSSYVYAKLRDYARFGMLYLHDGNWLGEQILPEDWVSYSTSPANGSEGVYGAFFWLNRSGSYPGVPPDMYSCNGHDGQFIYIIPSKELVVVRTGFSPKGTFDYKTMLRSIAEAVD